MCSLQARPERYLLVPPDASAFPTYVDFSLIFEARVYPREWRGDAEKDAQ